MTWGWLSPSPSSRRGCSAALYSSYSANVLSCLNPRYDGEELFLSDSTDEWTRNIIIALCTALFEFSLGKWCIRSVIFLLIIEIMVWCILVSITADPLWEMECWQRKKENAAHRDWLHSHPGLDTYANKHTMYNCTNWFNDESSLWDF